MLMDYSIKLPTSRNKFWPLQATWPQQWVIYMRLSQRSVNFMRTWQWIIYLLGDALSWNSKLSPTSNMNKVEWMAVIKLRNEWLSYNLGYQLHAVSYTFVTAASYCVTNLSLTRFLTMSHLNIGCSEGRQISNDESSSCSQRNWTVVSHCVN